jgi:hypothetical protein
MEQVWNAGSPVNSRKRELSMGNPTVSYIRDGGREAAGRAGTIINTPLPLSACIFSMDIRSSYESHMHLSRQDVQPSGKRWA